MKMKAIAGMILTLFLMATLFIVFPAKSQWAGTIKIGVIGPMDWNVGQGIANGAKLAAKQINEAGGIEGDPGEFWEVRIVIADTLRGELEPSYRTGVAAAMKLVGDECDFVVGGFTSEAVFGAREVFMDAEIPFIIAGAGASTNELIDCAGNAFGTGSPCGACVRCNYNRYRFVFRTSPTNATMLFYTIAVFLKYRMMVQKLMPIYTQYATPLKIAVISEDLSWADRIHAGFKSEIFWNADSPGCMNMTAYGGVSVVYDARVSSVATDVSSELLAAQAAGAKLIIRLCLGPVGRTMTTQWHDLNIPAVLAGINAIAQKSEFWEMTGGGCEYESFLSTAGTRIPISSQMAAFWNAYVDEYGHASTYTSYGAYEAVMAIKETIEEVGKWPIGAREIVPYIEKTFRLIGTLPGGTAMLGTFKYTGPHPMSPATYNATWTNGTHGALDVNPTMMGTLHDTFMTDLDLGPIWCPPYYQRPRVVQWHSELTPLILLYKHRWERIYSYWNETGEGFEELMRARDAYASLLREAETYVGRLKIVYPINMPYSRRVDIPHWMYERAYTDIGALVGTVKAIPDGLVDSIDVDIATSCWLCTSGYPDWVADGLFYGLEADIDGNNFINIADICFLGLEYGYSAIDEYGQWPLP